MANVGSALPSMIKDDTNADFLKWPNGPLRDSAHDIPWALSMYYFSLNYHTDALTQHHSKQAENASRSLDLVQYALNNSPKCLINYDLPMRMCRNVSGYPIRRSALWA